MNWSVEGQTPEFLAATRMVSLSDPIIATVLAHVGIAPGMRVLDVGCGSGEYCFRLGSAVEGVEFWGLEYDAAFVSFANDRAEGKAGYPFEAPNPANTYTFVCGDGLDLPFEDGSFDAVVSHTYLTALPDWACALAEMCRVCKPGGTVSSITSMTDNFHGTGAIGLFTNLHDAESAELIRLVEQAKALALPNMDLVSGIPPRKAPVAFEWIGLQDVACAPLAHYFCLSDAATDKSEARRYVDLLCAMERNQARRLMEHPATAGMLTAEQWVAYDALIDKRRNELCDIPANREWNWYGNASLLVCGTVPATPPIARWQAFRQASADASAMLQSCVGRGLVLDVNTTQLGPGRCARVVLARSDGSKLTVCGFDPPRTLVEACGVTLENEEADLLRVESRFRRETASLEDLPALANEVVYGIVDMWETVSEAAMSGISVQFKDAGTMDGCQVVACIATCGDHVGKSASAHPDHREAAMRSLARALGALKAAPRKS